MAMCHCRSQNCFWFGAIRENFLLESVLSLSLLLHSSAVRQVLLVAHSSNSRLNSHAPVVRHSYPSAPELPQRPNMRKNKL